MNKRSRQIRETEKAKTVQYEERVWLFDKLWLLWDGTPNGVPEFLALAESYYGAKGIL